MDLLGGLVLAGALLGAKIEPQDRFADRFGGESVPEELAARLLNDSPVADAAMRGDVVAVQALLAEGADVNEPQGDGMTALHWSAHNGDASLARILLDAGADVAAGTRIGHYTPLHLAAQAGAGEVVEMLLGAKADPSAPTEGAGAATPLHFAAASGSVRAVEVLVAAGANVNAAEEAWGQTPLIFAASKGRTEAVRALLVAGADASIHTRVVDVAARAVSDRIERAERNRRIAAGERWGPDVAEQVRREQEEETRRARAEEASRKESETRMIEEPEPLSYGELVGGHGGLTALLHAVREGHTETALALLADGADIDQASAGDGTSPILMATINGHYDLAMLLLERGADPNQTSHAGAAPLFAAINTHWAPKSRYPQQHIYMQQDHTHRHVPDGWIPAVRYLVEELGADVNARDHEGYAPLHHAAARGDNELIRYLVSQGADVMVVSRRGQTTVDMANGPVQRIQPFPATIALLEGLGAVNNHRCVSC